MSGYRYDGAPLSRGEFVTHMERVEKTLTSIDERVATIEEKISRPRRLLLGMVGMTIGRVLFLAAGVALTYLAARFGLPLL
jgi:hypothetical protein